MLSSRQIDDETHQAPKSNVDEIISPLSSPTMSLLSPEAMAMAGSILKFEEEQHKKTKVLT